jgi:hypothetical protein
LYELTVTSLFNVGPFVKNNNIDSLNDRKIIGCRKNVLSIFVALLTFYKFIIKKKKKKISHFKMPTLNSDVTDSLLF